MAAWTVGLSSDFIENIKKINADFKKQSDHAVETESTSEAARIDRRSEEFDEFLQAVEELKADPTQALRYCRDDKDGVPLYSLTCGRWRGLFRVNESQKTCDGISVDEMTSSARFAEQVRRPFRRRIKPSR